MSPIVKLILTQKEKKLNLYKKDFINFNLSLTCQCMINFITENKIDEYIKKHSTIANDNDIMTIFKILFIIFDNEYHSSEMCTIVYDFFTLLRTKFNHSSFKTICVNKLNDKLYLNKEKIKKIHILIETLSKEITFNDDIITNTLLIIIKEIDSYSQLKINNDIDMFSYLHQLKQLHMFKEEINNL